VVESWFRCCARSNGGGGSHGSLYVNRKGVQGLGAVSKLMSEQLFDEKTKAEYRRIV